MDQASPQRLRSENLSKRKWKFVWLRPAEKQLNKLDLHQQKLIMDYTAKIAEHEDPFVFATEMTGQWSGCWRFRVQKYRLICEPVEDFLLIEVIKIGKRDRVYD